MKNSTLLLLLCVVFILLWKYDTWICVLFGFLFSVSYDVHSIWRIALVSSFCRIRRKYKPKTFDGTNTLHVICLPTDVNIKLQLLPGRIIRECTFGHSEFWIENYISDALESLGATVDVESYYMSYTCPIKLFETFQIIAEILYWDDTAFYMKQSVVRNREKKTCATILSIHRVNGATTSAILNTVRKDRPYKKPVEPEFVRKFRDMHLDISKIN